MTAAPPTTLADWLLARIAEDEATALREPDWDQGLVYIPEHVARFSPARVLAECEAHRRIVESHAPLNRSDEHDIVCRNCVLQPLDEMVWADHELADWPCSTLRLLALPYADHDGYRDEWRP